MIIFEGKSNHDGQPIKVKITANSENPKTGEMVQSYIIRSDVEPHTAQKTGQDVSACGLCPLRPAINGGCYVQTFHGPLSAYRGKSDNTQDVVKALQSGQGLRLGSYGDPAMVPLKTWQALLESADFHTGYSHQWREPYAQEYKGILMASCNSMADVKEAKAMGWKVFATWKDIDKNDFRTNDLLATQCPSDPSLPSHRSCEECRLCNGKKADIWIKPHGTMKGKIK